MQRSTLSLRSRPKKEWARERETRVSPSRALVLSKRLQRRLIYTRYVKRTFCQ